MNCKICSQTATKQFSTKLLMKYDISYYFCSSCEFLCTEEPFWLEEAYENPIVSLDTGILYRNLSQMKATSVLIYFLFGHKGKFVDYAGGYGLYTRLMRDLGFDFYWDDKYCKNLFAQGFEFGNIGTSQEKAAIDVLTSFECFEHLADPLPEIARMLSIAPNIIFSTEFLPNPIPKPDQWWYYVPQTGQHIAFYRAKTLRFIAKKFNLHFDSNGGLHLFSEKKHSSMIFRNLMKYQTPLHAYITRSGSPLRSKTMTDFFMLSGKDQEGTP